MTHSNAHPFLTTLRRLPPALALAATLFVAPAAGQDVQVIEHTLDNGLTLLLVPRPGDPNVAAGWIAKVGSVYERRASPGWRTSSST